MTTTITTTDLAAPVRTGPAPGSGPRVARRTPEGWVDQPYRRFALTPATPIIGAEISGIDLADIDDELFADLHRALLEWKVLFFRDQHLTEHEHEALGRRWGELESHPFFHASNPQLEDRPAVVRLAKDDTTPGYENLWHSDVTWREHPSLGSLLRAVELPAVGGDTLWADMGAAYDGLPDEMRQRIDGLVATHDWIDTFGRAMDPAERDALRPNFPPVEHPVVRTHPETGRKTLYVNAAFTQHIVGMDPVESHDLLDRLYRQASHPEYQCRFRWSEGALAIWDNRSTQHYAASDYFPQRRVMERITVIGDRPY